MKTVIFNTALGSSNRGDDIIFDSAKEFLKPLEESGYTMYFGTHVKNVGVCGVRGIKVQFAQQSDYKFILGTNLLTPNIMRSMGQWQIGILDRIIYKKCILMGVGTTGKQERMTLHTKRLYDQILRKDIAHCVRDEKSQIFLSDIKGITVLNTGCPTLWKLTPEWCQKIPVMKSPNVIITVSGHKKHRNREKDQLLIDVIEKNYNKIYLWVQTTEDEQYYRSLNHKKDAIMLYTFGQYRKACENGKVDYVGTRLHGGIFAMQCGVRTLIIEIDHRAKGIRETNHINTLKRECLSEEMLESTIHGNIKTEIWLRETEIREWLSQFPNLSYEFR